MDDRPIKARKAQILLQDRLVGTLSRIATDEYRFDYDAAYRNLPDAIPLSLSLPLSQAFYRSEGLFPFFDNLLMEGKNFRRLSKEWGQDPRAKTDRFKLLMICGRDTIGAVEIRPLDENDLAIPFSVSGETTSEALTAIPLESAYDDCCPICLKPGKWHPACTQKLAGTRSELKIAVSTHDPREGFLELPEGASISGAQEKSLFRVHKGSFLPEIPSTHIIKPEGEYREMPANEHLTMTIARRAKFNVPWTGLFRAEGLGLLYIVKRFDRLENGDRVLLEDFAQILSYEEADKEGGSMEQVAAAIDRYCSSPVIERSEFFRRLLFSFIFCNGDMHLKNWSLAYDTKSRLYKLAPVYDWLNVRASMPREKVEMVLPLRGKRTGFERRDFEGFAADVLKLSDRFVASTLAEIPLWLSLAEELCPHSALSEEMKRLYLELVRERVQRLIPQVG